MNENGEINNEAFAMIPELMEMRRKDPQDDLLTGLVHAEIEEDDGTTRTLTLEEILAFMQLISSAGTETVARLLGFGVVTLQRFPDQRQLLLDDPSLMGNAVEELMRFEAPSPTQSRWVAKDTEYHGVTIPAGSKISLLNGAADRDERHFPNPDAFDVRRDIDRQLAFGYGAHFCIGAALGAHGDARRAGRDAEALPELRDRRVAARVRAHRDRARLQVGAHEGAVSAATSRSTSSRSSRSRARSARSSPASTSPTSTTPPSPQVRAIWLERLVVFFRDQELDADAFLAFARRTRRAGALPVREGLRHPPRDHRGGEAPARDGELRWDLAQRHRVPRAAADGDDAAGA